MRLRTIIIDDEELARQMIKEYLADFPTVEIAAECASGKQAVTSINALQPDLLFLDIQMPEWSGFEVLKRLDRIPFVIFSTAYDKYALQAFEVNAVDYLLKPYDRTRFKQAIERAFERMRNQESASEQIISLLNSLHPDQNESARFWIKDGGRLKPIKHAEIDWIEAMDDYVCLHVGKAKHLVNQTMRDLESRLDGKAFMRIHRSTIVNLDRISELKPVGDGSYKVILKDGIPLALSRSRARKVREMVI